MALSRQGPTGTSWAVGQQLRCSVRVYPACTGATCGGRVRSGRTGAHKRTSACSTRHTRQRSITLCAPSQLHSSLRCAPLQWPPAQQHSRHPLWHLQHPALQGRLHRRKRRDSRCPLSPPGQRAAAAALKSCRPRRCRMWCAQRTPRRLSASRSAATPLVKQQRSLWVSSMVYM